MGAGIGAKERGGATSELVIGSHAQQAGKAMVSGDHHATEQEEGKG